MVKVIVQEIVSVNNIVLITILLTGADQRQLMKFAMSPKGSFKRFLKKQKEEAEHQEKQRAKRIRKALANKEIMEPECKHCGHIYCDYESKY